MIQTRSAIRKLIMKQGLACLVSNIAFEIEQDANHYRTCGAKLYPETQDKKAAVLRKAEKALRRLE